jgi:WD40 repeat protein
MAGEDEKIYIYDPATGSLLKSFDDNLPYVPTRTYINYLQWNPGGTQVAGADSEGIHVWDVATGQRLTTLPYQTASFSEQAVAYSPDGALTIPAADGSVLLAPIAAAGADQTVSDSNHNGSEVVTLNGSGSQDTDGTIVSYSWTENGVQIATGVSPQVTLAVGTHTILLTITDNDGAAGGDVVVITVNALSTPTAAPTSTAHS